MTNPNVKTSIFQQAIDVIEALSLEDQEILIDIIQKRIKEQKRKQLLQDIAEVETEYAEGKVKFGTVDDFLAELDK
jgi:glycerol kinase